MLHDLGLSSRDELIAETIPEAIRLDRQPELPAPLSEAGLLEELRGIAGRNRVLRSYIGRGYHGTVTPPVLQRNILEDPGWYTQYTPYQSEISQGRLEVLLNFQTMVSDLTELPVAGASLLDEATAAAEAMGMCFRSGRGRDLFVVDENVHPQTLAVVRTRADAAGVRIEVRDLAANDRFKRDLAGVLVQYPDTRGGVRPMVGLAERVRAAGGILVVATDLLALTLLTPPGEFGADVAVGSTQRFGMPMGGGGPHAGFLATRDRFARRTPGRVVGVSRDADGRVAFRLALQTREQHIRRDKATSNICTAQVLPALVAATYAAWHGPEGLVRIARHCRRMAWTLRRGLRRLGFDSGDGPIFDTLHVAMEAADRDRVLASARARGINLGSDSGGVRVALDETVGLGDVDDVLAAFAGETPPFAARDCDGEPEPLPSRVVRSSVFLDHHVFHANRSEHEMLRCLHRLKERDLSLTTSMIPLGSCTMKLNATAEMIPMTWPEFAGMHPFAPEDQQAGYARIFEDLEAWLAAITGFHAVSLQPNAGSQGEFAGLLMIRRWHESRGDADRNVCLIPVSAHGTNPASASMAGLRVAPVRTTAAGDVDEEDLAARIADHDGRVAALMITYPSTHGVFEEGVARVCRMVHDAGGLVYMDGANLNAQVGLTSPAAAGADVCHINLHKTFCIPHGGGGPGMGPVATTRELAPFLPGHPQGPAAWGGDEDRIGAIAAAPYGSPAILPISWSYVRMMGSSGLKEASEVAILSANYMARRLGEHYPLLYVGERGRVAHEFIIDCRPFRKSAGVEVNDIAKRLMDYGFHAPTMSFPVAGTLMIEPTESEAREEMDRLCDALIMIRAEIREIEEGRMDRAVNPLRMAPHSALAVVADTWDRPYSRSEGAFPAPWTETHKYWPPVARVDNARGDRNLVCSCPDSWRSGEHGTHEHHDHEHHRREPHPA